MKDCDKDIRTYHDERVKLTEDQKKKLRDRRDANRDRLQRGLKNNGDPTPTKSVIQGSYAMGNRHPGTGERVRHRRRRGLHSEVPGRAKRRVEDGPGCSQDGPRCCG